MFMCLFMFFRGGGGGGVGRVATKGLISDFYVEFFLVAQTSDFWNFYRYHISLTCARSGLILDHISSYLVLFHSFFTAFQAQKREQILNFVKNTPQISSFSNFFSEFARYFRKQALKAMKVLVPSLL